MYFYIDESGNTGPNLFDSTQPFLYYGVLFSPMDVDVLAGERLRSLRALCSVDRLHAAELGNRGLSKIIGDVVQLESELSLRFDLYRVNKRDHAVLSFFDQVFDQGNNPAVTWMGYWTPLRYPLLMQLSLLFDKEIAKRAWSARLDLDDERSDVLLASVCGELKSRVRNLADARARQLIFDALEWAERNPRKISYNSKNKMDRLSVMPNIIGFQSVILGMGVRLKEVNRSAKKIVVDQQMQFNKAQKTLADFYVSNRNTNLITGPGLPEVNLENIPTIPLEFSSDTASPGLELTDVYLWLFKRFFDDGELAPVLRRFIGSRLHHARGGEVSLKAISRLWEEYLEGLPEPTVEDIERGRALIAEDEARRLHAIGKGFPK